jgi:hypothetical protein
MGIPADDFLAEVRPVRVCKGGEGCVCVCARACVYVYV